MPDITTNNNCDIFISYAHADNIDENGKYDEKKGWISIFINKLKAEYSSLTGRPENSIFIDFKIRNGTLWEDEISRLINKHPPNTEIWAYSSRVKHTSTPKSDLYLVAITDKTNSRATYDLREAFE